MRYRVSDLPVQGVGAFTPLPAMNPEASSHGLVHVDGSPGTLPIPSPKPQRNWLPSRTKQGGVNSAQDSMVAPDFILPCLYEAGTQNMGPEADTGLGMARRRFCELPMPALNPVRVPVVSMGAPAVGGRAVIAWPRAFQRWPNRTGGTS